MGDVAEAPLIIGITGASGATLAERVMRRVIASVPLIAIATEAGQRVWAEELGRPLKATLTELAERAEYADIRDIGHRAASGSVPTRGMVIIPASMDAVSAIATGRESNLLERVAGVTIKEGRPLTLVPRETPLSAIHLRNLLTLARLGARIVPPMPAFYLLPRSLDELYDALAGRIVQSLGLPEIAIDSRFVYKEDV